MNAFQSCKNSSDAVALYLPQNLFLKPIARIHISVQLPQQIEPGKSISNWEIMEKLRTIIKPEEFSILKVSKSTLEFIRFEAEIEDKSKLFRVVALIEGKTMKLNAFPQNVKIRASEAKLDFPNRHAWDSFFRDAKNMDEMKPGERPDTIHFSNLPIKWFIPPQHANKDDMKPSQKIFHRIFEKFGHIRCVDIPICDPYRNKMKEHMTGMNTFTFDQDTLFEGYVQFKDYVGFTQTLDAFRGMKLLHKGPDKAETINVLVDFDKTKHLSDSSIRRRQIVRDRLIAKDRDKEEKEKQVQAKQDQEEQSKRESEIEQKEAKERRQREREEKRKARHFVQLKLKETAELKKKIVKEEHKLLKAQRKLQAIRLIGELFNRIKVKKEKADAIKSDIDKNSHDEISKLKHIRERKVKEQREKLHKALEGRVVLNSILGDDKAENTSSNSSTDSDSDQGTKNKRKKKKSKKKKKKSKSHKEKHKKSESETKPPESSGAPSENPFSMGDPNWFGCVPYPAMFGPHMRGVPPNGMYPYPPMFGPPIRGVPPQYYPFPGGMKGRGAIGAPGPSRGQYPRRRGNYNPHWSRGWRGRRGSVYPQYTPELEQEYYKYFRKFLEEDQDDRSSRNYSRSRSRSRSSSYSRSRSRRRSYSRSKSRRRTRSQSRSRSKSSSRSRNRTRSRRRSNKSKSRSRTRSRSHSREKSPRNRKSRSYSRGKSPRDRKSRSSSYKSIDSSKFISPSRLRSKRSRSKSWSLPRNLDKTRSSWSKSPNSKK